MNPLSTIEQSNYLNSLFSKTAQMCCTQYCQGSTLEVSFGKVEKIIEQNVEDPLEPTDEELRAIKHRYQSEVLGRIYEVYLWGETMSDRHPEYWQRLCRLGEQGLRNWDNRFLLSLSAVPLQRFEECLEALESKLGKLKEITIEKLRSVVAKFHHKEQKRLSLSKKTTEKDLTFIEQKFELLTEQENWLKGAYEAGGLSNKQVVEQLEAWGWKVDEILTKGDKIIRRLETEERAKEQIQYNYQQLSLKFSEQEQQLQEMRQKTQAKEEESDRLKRELEEAQKEIATLKELDSKGQEKVTEGENQETVTETGNEKDIEAETEDLLPLTVLDNQSANQLAAGITGQESGKKRAKSQRKFMPFEPRQKNPRNQSKKKSKGKSQNNSRNNHKGSPLSHQSNRAMKRRTSTGCGFGKR